MKGRPGDWAALFVELQMGMYDSLWDRASALLDRGVDGVLGDRIRYRHNGTWLTEGGKPTIPGFVVFDVENPNFSTERDETLGHKKQVKVAVRFVDQPLQTDRIQHPKLGDGMFRPAGADPENDGRYWIFDVQKVSA